MSRSALIRLGVLAGIWGCSFLFIKVALEGMAPAQIVLGRMAAGAAALLLVAALRHQPLPREPVVWFHLAAFSVLGNLLPFFLIAWGEQRISSGRAGVLNATTPLCTLLAAMAFLRAERPTVQKVTGLLVGFAGVLVVVAPWADQGGGKITGQLACFTAAALYGVGFVYSQLFVSGRSLAPGALAAGQLLAGTVLLALVTPVLGWPALHLNVRIVLSVLTLGAMGTGFAYLLYHGLMRDAGATSTSLVTYLIPVTAVTLGVVVLGEPLTWNLFVGAVVVITGVAIAEGRLVQPARRATMFRRT